MSYRITEQPKPKPQRTVEDMVTMSTVFVQNGATFDFAIPCWYIVVDPPRKAHHHSRMHHDHVGWPSPNHPDHICQSWDFAHSCCSFDRHKHHCDYCHRYLDMDNVLPIHLTKEGYDNIKVAIEPSLQGLSACGYIDEKRDWIIRINIDSNIESAIEKKQEVKYSVFANGIINKKKVTDIVANGKIVILPGPIVKGVANES